MNTTNTPPDTSFEAYRSAYDSFASHHSIEAEGLFDQVDFDRAVSDPNTTLYTPESLGIKATLPLLTNADNYRNWLNMRWYKENLGGSAPIDYLSHLSVLYGADPVAYAEALTVRLQHLADQGGSVIFDHTDHASNRVNSDLGAIALAAGVTLQEHTAATESRHFHYASSLTSPNEEPQTQRPDSLQKAYGQGLVSGALQASQTEVVRSLKPADTDQIWSFYKPVFDTLSNHDPIHSGFTEQEFTDLMESTDCVKFLYKADDTIVNLFFMIDIKDCSWMNQTYFKNNFAQQYDDGRVYCAPGIIANPNVRHKGSSQQTMGLAARVIKLSGIEPVITFACNVESNQLVPKHTQRFVTDAGLECDYTQPVGHQVFRMMRVVRKT